MIAQLSPSACQTRIEELAARARAASTVSPTESLRIAEIVSEMAEVAQSSRAHAFAQWSRAAALRALTRCEEALAAFLLGARFAAESGDPVLAARIPLGATETMAQLGRYDEALLLSSSLEERLNALGLAEDAAKVVANAGNVHFQRESYAQALACWERALAFFVARGDQIRSARLQMNVANVLTCLQRLPESLHMYAAARAILESAGMELLVAGLDGDLAFVHFMAGHHTEALQAYTRARQRFEALESTKDVAKCDRETADVYLDLNLIPEAREIYERVLPVFHQHQQQAEAARCESSLALTLFEQEQRNEAFAALERAEQAFQQEGNHAAAARVWLRRASFLHRSLSRIDAAGSPQADAARSAASAALQIFQNQGLRLEAVQARLLLAEIGIRQGQSPLRALRQCALEADAGAFRALEWRIEAALARASVNAGRQRAALGHYRLAVQAVERLRLILRGDAFRIAFLQDKRRLYEELIGLLLDLNTPAAAQEAFTVLEQAKSRTLLESLTDTDTETADVDSERAALLHHLEDLRAQINWQYVRADHGDIAADRLPGVSGVTPEGLRGLESEYLKTHRQLEIFSTRRYGQTDFRPLAIADLQAELDEDEQIVLYATVGDEILAYVVARNGFDVLRGVASLAEVTELAERLRFQWHKKEMQSGADLPPSPTGDTTTRILRNLYELLIEPMQDLLTGQRLTIVPHDVLHDVPFHALHDGATYLLDRWEVGYAPSGAIWRACRRRPDPQSETSLVFGVPDPAIEHARHEVDHLRRALPGATVFEEAAATLAAVPTEGVFRYIHFATHAVFRKDNPLFSALRMADGWLFAHDLYRRRLDCSLATLSACHTGTGAIAPGDEVLGLVRGFLHAGAHAVLVSRWAADDAATAMLMQLFYEALSQGRERTAALRFAQQKVRERWIHPYYWAVFSLVGGR